MLGRAPALLGAMTSSSRPRPRAPRAPPPKYDDASHHTSTLASTQAANRRRRVRVKLAWQLNHEVQYNERLCQPIGFSPEIGEASQGRRKVRAGEHWSAGPEAPSCHRRLFCHHKHCEEAPSFSKGTKGQARTYIVCVFFLYWSSKGRDYMVA